MKNREHAENIILSLVKTKVIKIQDGYTPLMIDIVEKYLNDNVQEPFKTMDGRNVKYNYRCKCK